MTVGYPAKEVDNMSKLRYAIAVNINNLHIYIQWCYSTSDIKGRYPGKYEPSHLNISLVGSKDGINIVELSTQYVNGWT